MSSPARCWSSSREERASVYFSRKATSFMHVESGRPASWPSNHFGRGHEPVTVVGRTRSAVAVYIGATLLPEVVPERSDFRTGAFERLSRLDGESLRKLESTSGHR